MTHTWPGYLLVLLQLRGARVGVGGVVLAGHLLAHPAPAPAPAQVLQHVVEAAVPLRLPEGRVPHSGHTHARHHAALVLWCPL